MGDPHGAVKGRAPLDQNIEIKKAVDALGQNSEKNKLLSLLASCATSEEKDKCLKEFQNQFRQKYDKEVRIEHDRTTGQDIVCVKKWTAQEIDREALSTAATHVVAKLWKNPKAKVEVDEWLQKYSLDNPGGKLQWMKEYCKNALGQDVVLSKVHTKHGDKIVASLRGELTLPSVPKAPIPTALKEDKQKTTAELQQEANKPYWNKIQDAVLDEAAEVATVSSEVVQDVSKGEFSSAANKIYNYASEKAEAVVDLTVAIIPEPVKQAYNEYFKPTVDKATEVVSNIWKGTTELVQGLGEKTGFLSAAKKDKPDVITEVDEAEGAVIFKVEVQEEALPQTRVALSTKPTLKLPKKPAETVGEVREKELPLPLPSEAPAKVETAVVVHYKSEPLVSSIVLPPPVVTFPERPAERFVNVYDYKLTTPPPPSPISEFTPELKASLSVLDLPIQPKSSFMDSVLTAVRTQLEATKREWEDAAPTEQRAPNVIATVVASMTEAAPILAAQAAATNREEYVEQTTRQAVAMLAPGVTPTSSSIHAAELALVSLVDAKASAFEIERLSSLIRSAKNQLEKKNAEDEVRNTRVLNA